MVQRVDSYYDLNKGLKKKRAYKNLPSDLKAPPDLIEKQYDHVTFLIRSVSDFMKILQVLNTNSTTYAFRGMSNYKYELIPSIARGDIYLMDDVENCMVNEMITLRPEEFNNISSGFELLAKMQHFGLPTRLLDFSLNPLVALYFACSKQFKTTGRVVCVGYTINTNLDNIIEAFCNLYKYSDLTSVMADDIFQTREALWTYSFLSRYPMLKKPKYFDDRISHQSAVFLVFPNQLYDRFGRAAYLENIISDRSNIFYYSRITQSDRKTIDFIKQYESFEKIYPKIQSSVNTDQPPMLDFDVTTESLSEQFHLYGEQNITNYYGVPKSQNSIDPFKNRYSVEKYIQPISDFSIKNYFCSILIDPSYKKSILEELNIVGINEPFIYPELEYTAKYVKQHFFTNI